MSKPETLFRVNVVDPFLKGLEKKFPVHPMTIQQVTIHGDPDKILCIRGRFVALELKDEGEEPTPLQYYKLNRITRAGGISLWSSPDKWEKTKDGLYKLAKGISL